MHPHRRSLMRVVQARGHDLSLGLLGCLHEALSRFPSAVRRLDNHTMGHDRGGTAPPSDDAVLRPAHPGQQQQQHQARPTTAAEVILVKRLAGDPDTCFFWLQVVDGVKLLTVSPRMQETFLCLKDVHGMPRLFDILASYLWCTFVVPEDRGRLMCAFVSAVFECSMRVHVDTAVRCVTRDGKTVNCLASIGCHADPNVARMHVILRLWPLEHRSLPMVVVAGGNKRGAAREVGEAARQVGGGGGGKKRDHDGARREATDAKRRQAPAYASHPAAAVAGRLLAGAAAELSGGSGKGPGMGQLQRPPRPFALPLPPMGQESVLPTSTPSGPADAAMSPFEWAFVLEAMAPVPPVSEVHE